MNAGHIAVQIPLLTDPQLSKKIFMNKVTVCPFLLFPILMNNQNSQKKFQFGFAYLRLLKPKNAACLKWQNSLTNYTFHDPN